LIGPIGFAARSLRRRGFHALLAFLGLALTVFSATFLPLLGGGISTHLNVESGPRATFGIAWLFYAYLLISLIFTLVVGLVSVSYLVSSMISQRMKDIAVAKAAGALPRLLSSYAMTEPLLILSSGCLAGALSALIAFASWSQSIEFSQTGDIILVVVPGISFLMSYVTARYQVRKIMRISTLSGVSSQLSSMDLKSLGKPLRVRRLGSSFNLAARTLLRDRQFGRTTLRIIICIFLAMVVLTGALVSWDTSKGYVEQAMPQHLLIVGSQAMVSQYIRLADSFSNPTPLPAFQYLNASYLISKQVSDGLRGVAGVQAVDARLITNATIAGYVKAHFASGGVLSGESTSPEIIPEAYTGSAEALIIGVNPSETIPTWYTSDGFLQATDSNNTLVSGDSFAGGIVQMPLNLSEVGWLGQRFNVKSVLVDPLNGGRVMYSSLQFLQQIYGTNDTNIMLVKTDNDPSTISRIQNFATVNQLSIEPQDPALTANLSFLDNTWTYLLLLPILTLALASGILLSYLTTNYSKRFNDYIVLKILGARPRYTTGLLLWEGWGILALSMIIAIPLAFVLATVLLIPDSKLQSQSLALSAVAGASALTLASLLSAGVYSRRLRRMTVKDLRI
jgi:ABC-type antimicrobial peptide transport system permease subunit